MNKKYMFGFLFLFAVGLVSAGYLVNSFILTTDVYEPFVVEYAIIGDASNWDGVTTCETYDGEWFAGEDVDVGGLFAGESRVVCTRITNLGEGDVDYTFSGEVVGGDASCYDTFTSQSVSGTVEGLGTITDGVVVEVSDGADPTEDCQVELSVTRG